MLPGRTYTPEELLAIAWRRKWLLLSVTMVLTSAAVAASYRLPELYASETLILVVPQRVPESYVRSTVTVRIEDRLRSITPQILSRSRLERVIADFDLYREQRQNQPMEQIVARMRDNVTVNTVREDAFTVQFVSTDPRTAMIVADRLATMFIEENVRDREQQAHGTNLFLESQLHDARNRLIAHEEKLEAYRKRYSGELPSQLQVNLQVLQSSQRQLQDLTESLNRDRDRRMALERSLADAAAWSETGSPDDGGRVTEEQQIVAQLDRERSALRQLEARLRPEHPDVRTKIRMIADLEQKLREVAAAPVARPVETAAGDAELARLDRVRAYQREIEQVDQQIAGREREMQRLRQTMLEYQRRVEAVPGHESELTALMRDYQTLQHIYQDLLTKKENSQISANLEREQAGEQFRILDAARLPEEPFSPNRPRIALIAAALSIGAAFALIGLLEYRDASFRTEDDIVRTLSLPVMAIIPTLSTAIERQRRRRRQLAVVAAAMLVLSSAGAAVLWHLNR